MRYNSICKMIETSFLLSLKISPFLGFWAYLVDIDENSDSKKTLFVLYMVNVDSLKECHCITPGIRNSIPFYISPNLSDEDTYLTPRGFF